MSRKMKLEEEIVKYIFGFGSEPEIAIGEDGYVVYDFKNSYPSKLAVFVPIEVERSNFSSFFPKSFEDYFRDLDLEISRLSLLMEQGNLFNRFVKADYVPGKVIRTEGEYTLFRFDEGLDVMEKDELLCRTPVDIMSASDIEQTLLFTDVHNVREYVDVPYGTRYFYWFLPVGRLVRFQRELPEEIKPLVMKSICR